MSQVEATELNKQHKGSKCLNYKYKNVEKNIFRFIQDVPEDQYIEHLIDEDTRLIQEGISTVLEYLFDNYIKVPSEEAK